MGDAGDSPAPVGPSSVALRRVDDPPTGSFEWPVSKSGLVLAGAVTKPAVRREGICLLYPNLPPSREDFR